MRAIDYYRLTSQVVLHLQCDHVQSRKQMLRIFPYPGSFRLDREVHLHERIIQAPPFGNSTDQMMEHKVYTLRNREILKFTPMQMVHLMGTAEMRYSLGAPVSTWQSTAGELGASFQPDALWHDGGKVYAIEYDTGNYKGWLVREKIRVFTRSYDGIIWGTPSRLRAKRMGEAHPNVRMLVVEWW